MRQGFGLRQVSILLFLLLLAGVPRPLAGWIELQRASNYLEGGNSSRGGAALALAAARIPGRNDLWGRAGQAALQAGELEQALARFGEGEKHAALSATDWLAYGDTYLAVGDTDSAVSAWETSIQSEPSAAAYLRLAKVRRDQGEFSGAIEFLQEAAAISPDDADAHYQLGLLLLATDPAKSLPELLKAASLDPTHDETIQSIRIQLNLAFLVDDPAYQFTVAGRALASIGEWDLATESFRRAVELNLEYGDAWAWLGEAFQQTGRDGRPYLDMALALAPRSASVQALDGLYWLRNGQAEKALAAYQKAADLEPDNANWQIALGDAAAAANQLVDATSYYHRAVELAPKDPAAWRALALFSLHYDTDIQNTGLFAARQLLKLAPNDWLTFDIAGQVATLLLAQGEAAGAFTESNRTRSTATGSALPPCPGLP